MTIRKVEGVLHIMDNEELKELSFFSGLKEIDAGSKEQRECIEIKKNIRTKKKKFMRNSMFPR